MVPLRVSITKFEWLPDDPTAFVPSMQWKLPFITTWDDSQNQSHPTDSAEEAFFLSAMICTITQGSDTRLKAIAVDDQTGTRLSIIDESRGPAGTDPCTGGYGNLEVIGEV